jgi:sarcosine oxidase
MKMVRRDFMKSLAAGALLPALRGAKSAQIGARIVNVRSEYDVAVIGAGVFGSWTARELRQAGRSVVLLDAYGPANSRASSGGESRIIRMGYGPDEIYTRWAMRSLPRWKELFAQAGQPALFQPTGVLWIAHEGERYAMDTLAVLQKTGAHFEKLSHEDLTRRFPQIVFDPGAWGIFEPESGVLMARRAVQAVVQDAIAHGVDYLAEAVSPPLGTGHADYVLTSGGVKIRAKEFVFACGPWLPKVFPEVVGGRIFPTRQEVFFFGVPRGDPHFAPPLMPTWINLGDEFYGMPDLEGRGFKIANDRHGAGIDPDTAERTASAEGLRAARYYVAKRFPALHGAPMLETRVCQYENTSNGDFLVDRHPALDNVWLVGGGSGHGFKHGPALGEYVANQITGHGSAEPRFSLATKQTVQKRAVF